MTINLPTRIICGECGSVDHYESFARSDGVSGMRCLACKHEKIKYIRNTDTWALDKAYSLKTPYEEKF
jgi:hypothetical protein